MAIGPPIHRPTPPPQASPGKVCPAGRVKGFRDMKRLVAALDRRAQEGVETKKKVA
jgi:hypothetical protein